MTDLNITMGNGGKMTIAGTNEDDSIGIYKNLAGEQWIDTNNDGQYGAEDVLVSDYLDQYNADNDTSITESQVRIETKLGNGDDTLTVGKGVTVGDITDHYGDNTFNIQGSAGNIKAGAGWSWEKDENDQWYQELSDNTFNIEGSVKDITTYYGNDTVNIEEGASAGKVKTYYGENNYNVNGSAEEIYSGYKEDNLAFGNAAQVGKVTTGGGDDNITIAAGAVLDELNGNGGVDTITGSGTVKNIIDDGYDLIDAIIENSQDEE